MLKHSDSRGDADGSSESTGLQSIKRFWIATHNCSKVYSHYHYNGVEKINTTSKQLLQ